jgi:DNA-binding GntR family transcriptional regulator
LTTSRERSGSPLSTAADPAASGPSIRDNPDYAPTGTTVLAERIAAMLVHHEPGWRLPRYTILARRFNASASQIGAAIDELTTRHHLRQLPDGQVYRASPADYLISLDGLTGLGTLIDPMGATVKCVNRYGMRRQRVPEEIAHALHIPSQAEALTIRCLWTADGCNAAMSTTYLPDQPDTAAEHESDAPTSLDEMLSSGLHDSRARSPQATWRTSALSMELQLPSPYLARALRLAPGQAAIAMTIAFEGVGTGSPTAVTVTMLRPDRFRIVIQAPAGGQIHDTAALGSTTTRTRR